MCPDIFNSNIIKGRLPNRSLDISECVFVSLFFLLKNFFSIIVSLYSTLLISQHQIENTWPENMGCAHDSTLTLTFVPEVSRKFLNLSKTQGPH